MLKYRLARYSLVLLVWCLFAATATTFTYQSWRLAGENASWLNIARRQFVTYMIWAIIISPSIFWLCRRFPLDKSNWPRILAIHVMASIGAAGVHAVLRAVLNPITYPGDHKHGLAHLVGMYFLANGYNDLWMYWLFAFLAFSAEFYRKSVNQEVSAAKLQVQLARTELQMLKMQLQPHFLFNTLHSISALMQRDVVAADRMLVQLSDLLRITFSNAGTEFVPLKRELDLVSGYLEIEKTRFQDRLTVISEIDPEALDAHVPSMLLQPLIENAVRHGIAQRSGAGEICIRVVRWHDRLRITVVNDAPVEGGANLHGNGIGLSNTIARLKYLYPNRHTIRAGRELGKFEVEVEFPITDDQVSAFMVRHESGRKQMLDMRQVQ